MKKRGQFEIQFNWIFVLVVGGIILLFFTAIMFKQKNVSEQTTNIAISRNLGAIVAGAEVSTGTVNFVDLSKVEIEFECDGYRIGSDRKADIKIMSVFAPSKIKSDKMITWTLDWSLPYRVTNFLYLTSPNIRYILVGDDDLALGVNKTVPKEFNKELVKLNDINNIKNKNDDKVRFVFFNTDVDNSVISKFDRMSDKDVSALKVNGGEDTGIIEFFEKKGNRFVSKGVSYYLTSPSLIGAVFTDNVGMYKCIMDNAFKKLEIITGIYKKKTENLWEYYNEQGDNCKLYHTSSHIDEILSHTRNILSTGVFDKPKLDSINSASKVLEQQNRQAQLHSCALIY